MSAVPSTAVAAIGQRVSLVQKFASKFSIEPDKLMGILKATAFKQKEGEVSNEQMAALLVVADQYGLNPFTREIFAFPDKQNGIVPVIGVDGWSRIINDHPQSDGFYFRESEKLSELPDARPCPEWMEVIIYRKDRSNPIIVREYLDEVYRPLGKYADGNKHKPGPWQTHTKRFLRHKTLIQGARIAYGFGGIYDEDEAVRIIGEGSAVNESRQPAQRGVAGLKAAIAGTQGAAEGVATEETVVDKGRPAGTLEERDALIKKFGDCKDTEILALVADELRQFEWSPADQTVINEAYNKRRDELERP